MNLLIIHKNYLKALKTYENLKHQDTKIIFFIDDFIDYCPSKISRNEDYFRQFFGDIEYEKIIGEEKLLNFIDEETKEKIVKIHYFSIECDYELKLKEKLQNISHSDDFSFYTSSYLFDEVENLKSKNSFTSFRKKYENKLPEMFKVKHEIPSESEIYKDLNFYFTSKKPSVYFETRNQLLGERFSTRFSTYLSLGMIDPKEIYNLVKQYEKEFTQNKSTYWIIFELIWREFFYWHYQKHKLKYFSINGLNGEFKEIQKVDSFNKLEDKVNNHYFSKAALNELKTTGFQSNRTRQIFASVLINDLNIPWWEGAQLFQRYLDDYDPYSNFGNWMYLAGVGVDPRGKRYFNVEKQLSNYDPQGMYLKSWS